VELEGKQNFSRLDQVCSDVSVMLVHAVYLSETIVLELTFRCSTAPYDGHKQVGMIVSMSGQGLERRKDTGRSDPSRGGVGSIVRVNENWTAGEWVRMLCHHDEIFFCVLLHKPIWVLLAFSKGGLAR
jgi:hypothetical protein